MTHFVVAFIHEAKPLISYFGLKKCAGIHPYAIYESEQYRLVISDIGKLCAAGAVAYLQGRFPQDAPVLWLNIGIVGHRDMKVGQAFVAHRINDAATGVCYFPPLIFSDACETLSVTTVDRPESNYGDDCLYDMEASGFYLAALKSVSIEWVHSYKIVSDNRGEPVEKITKQKIAALVGDKLGEIDVILANRQRVLKDYEDIHEPHPETEAILSRWHFTVTQNIQLVSALRRWQTLGLSDSVFSQFEDCKNAKDCLANLNHSLATQNWAI